MKKFCSIVFMIAALPTSGAWRLSFAQTPMSILPPSCKDSHRVFAPKNPQTGTNGGILPGQAIVQLKLILNDGSSVRVIERPRSEKDFDNYNSEIIIERGKERKEYVLKRLIKYGALLRIVEVASFCSPPDKETVFLAFEAPSTGSAEGFAIIQSSATSTDVRTLPLVDEGRIVVNKADPSRVELWSARGSASKIDCDACKKHYTVQDCEIGEQSVTCSPRAGVDETRSPGMFIAARIEVH
jgi:hypothetical protein